MSVLRILVGKHQIPYALMAVIFGVVAFGAWQIGQVSEEQYYNTFAVYLMMWLSSTIAAINYKTYNEPRPMEKGIFLNTFWHVCRIPYLFTCLATVVYLIDLSPKIGGKVALAGYATLACFLISIIIWMARRGLGKLSDAAS